MSSSSLSASNKKIVKLFNLITKSVSLLENWPSFIINFLWVRLAKRPLYVNEPLKLKNGLSFSVHPKSIALYDVFADIFQFSIYDGHPSFEIGVEDIIIDIGANVGFFAAKSAQSASKGKVYAFEPCSFHFDLLNDNLTKNHIENVCTFKQAIWGKQKQLELFYSFDVEPDNTSLYKVGGTEKEIVEAVTLENVFQRENIKVCDLLKIDCEGAEYEILYKTPDYLFHAIRKIAMEWHRFDETHDPEKLAQFLSSKGFILIKPKDWSGKTGYLYAYRQ